MVTAPPGGFFRRRDRVGFEAAAGAVVIIAVWILNSTTDLEVTAEVAAAMTLMLTFITSYFVKNRAYR
jgi:hypothetical protein